MDQGATGTVRRLRLTPELASAGRARRLVDAALLELRLDHLADAVALSDPSPCADLRHLDHLLLRAGADEAVAAGDAWTEPRFCTVVLITLEESGVRATICSAGHPLPEEGIVAVLRSAGEGDAATVAARVEEAAQTFVGGAVDDDMAVVVVRVPLPSERGA